MTVEIMRSVSMFVCKFTQKFASVCVGFAKFKTFGFWAPISVRQASQQG